MSEVEQWHVWTVRSGKLDMVTEHVASNFPEIKEVLAPTVVSERRLKSGRFKKKRMPLYQGYLFMRYQHTDDLWHRLKEFLYMKEYVGKCSQKDVAAVYNLKHIENLNCDMYKSFKEGDQVRVNGGPFKGTCGEVLLVRNTYIQVSMNAFGRNDVKSAFSPDDLDILGRGKGG